MHYILKQVKHLQRKYHTANPFLLARDLNIHVRYHQLGRLKGYYLADHKRRFIVINSALDVRMRQVVCAHELGHDRLHQPIAGYSVWKEEDVFSSGSRPEREANLFAAELLIPDQTISSFLTQVFSIDQISSQLELPVDLVLFKLQALRLNGWKLNLPWLMNSDFLKGER